MIHSSMAHISPEMRTLIAIPRAGAKSLSRRFSWSSNGWSSSGSVEPRNNGIRLGLMSTIRPAILADIIEATAASHDIAQRPIAIAFSNDAIMAAALLLSRPGLLAGAILFRPLSPFSRDLPIRLDGIPVLVIDGQKDSRRSPGDGARLAERLSRAGAVATHHVLPVGHSITAMDQKLAGEWLGNLSR